MHSSIGSDEAVCAQSSAIDSVDDEQCDEHVASMSLLQFMRSLPGAEDADAAAGAASRHGPFSRPGSAKWLRGSRPSSGLRSFAHASFGQPACHVPQSPMPADASVPDAPDAAPMQQCAQQRTQQQNSGTGLGFLRCSGDLTAKVAPANGGMRARGAAGSIAGKAGHLRPQYSNLSDVEMRPGTALVESAQSRTAEFRSSREGSGLGVTEVSLADMAPHLFTAPRETPSSSARHDSARRHASGGQQQVRVVNFPPPCAACAHGAFSLMSLMLLGGVHSVHQQLVQAEAVHRDQVQLMQLHASVHTLKRTDRAMQVPSQHATGSAGGHRSAWDSHPSSGRAQPHPPTSIAPARPAPAQPVHTADDSAHSARPATPVQRAVQSARPHSPSEPVLDASVWSKQAIARPPSRQKPPPEALHLFAAPGLWDGERARHTGSLGLF